MTAASVYKKLIVRDLNKLKDELMSYENEEDLWRTNGLITNPGGTLALHLVGNLNHFIGATLGDTGYVRDRNAEFADKNVRRDKLLRAIDDVRDTVASVLSEVDDEKLKTTYPLDTFGEGLTVQEALLNLCVHLSYHLGQVNYHRRLI